MDMGGMHGHLGMNMTNSTHGSGGMMHGHHMMMHMTFFWGKNAEILFNGFPGYYHLGKYIGALVVVFLLAVLVEWLSHSKFIKENSDNVVAGLIQTVMYGVRIGLAYMVMLAVMSFNGGVFLVAIAGHTLGFLVFGSRVFNKSDGTMSGKTSDLPPMTC